jgi:ketosteroid isomerase-like protein
MTSRAHVTEWLAGYERAWRTAGTDGLDQLFTEDATYQLDPYEPAIEGLGQIAGMWEREREGPDERFTMESAVVAVDGDTAVIRVEVRYADPPPRKYRDLWVLEFDPSGRCRSFEEWPFWPERPRVDADAAPR